MVHYIRNLDLFEDYPRALEDEEYDAEDQFASYKRYSVSHIDDIIFRMSYDADFYAILDPQLESVIGLEDSGGYEFIVEPDCQNPVHDYPYETAEIVDEDWYPPHPALGAVLAGVTSLQPEVAHKCTNDGRLLTHLVVPDVPFDATALETINVYPNPDGERKIGLQQTEEQGASVRQSFDVELSLLCPSELPYQTPVKKSEDEPIHPTIPDTPRHPSS